MFMHCKGFLEKWLTFEALRFFIHLLFSFVICVCLPVFKAKSDSRRWEEYMLLIQVSLCYILKHLEDRKTSAVHIYYTWCDIILIFELHRRTQLTPCSLIYSLKIRRTSHPCNKYEHTTLSCLLSVKHTLYGWHWKSATEHMALVSGIPWKFSKSREFWKSLEIPQKWKMFQSHSHTHTNFIEFWTGPCRESYTHFAIACFMGDIQLESCCNSPTVFRKLSENLLMTEFSPKCQKRFPPNVKVKSV